MEKKKIILYVPLVFLLILAVVSVVKATVDGATVTALQNTTMATVTPNQVAAFAGNITRLNVESKFNTRAWQGYFGNVSEAIALEDSSGNKLYNWTEANPKGEIYVANDTPTFTEMQCFNLTANGTLAGDNDAPGSTSVKGLNATTLESQFGIQAAHKDGVTETFSDSTSHNEFLTGSLNFTVAECPAVNLNDASGPSSNFQEALLYAPSLNIPVFASLIKQNGATGFDSGTHEFEAIVLEDGHSGNTALTTYYFYIELDTTA